MFKGRVEKVSHEGGLLISYSGACPALGSVMVDSSETYIGKVDGVIGNLNESLVHVAHLDRKANASEMIGIEITIRTKKQRDNRNSNDDRRGRDDRRRRDDSRGGERRGRDERRGGERRGRDDRRGQDNRRDRRGNHSNNDWECPKCQNSNFAFRTECNRCGEPKGGSFGRRGGDNRRGGDRRGRDNRNNRDNRSNDRRGQDNRRDRRGNQGNHSNNDWECKECKNSNFSFRTECNRCGAPKGRGRAPSKNWEGNDRRPGDRREAPKARPGDWDCPQCGKSNFAKRNECFSCGRSKRVGGPRKGHHRKLKDPLPLHSVKYGNNRRSRR